MATGRLVVCEKSGAWAAALGRWWTDDDVERFGSIAQVRTTAALWRAMEEHTASVAAVELVDASAEATLETLQRIDSRFADARTFVFASRSMAAYEWLARELGALAFVTSPRDLSSEAELARRHLRRVCPEPEDPLQRVRARLPWS